MSAVPSDPAYRPPLLGDDVDPVPRAFLMLAALVGSSANASPSAEVKAFGASLARNLRTAADVLEGKSTRQLLTEREGSRPTWRYVRAQRRAKDVRKYLLGVENGWRKVTGKAPATGLSEADRRAWQQMVDAGLLEPLED